MLYAAPHDGFRQPIVRRHRCEAAGGCRAQLAGRRGHGAAGDRRRPARRTRRGHRRRGAAGSRAALHARRRRTRRGRPRAPQLGYARFCGRFRRPVLRRGAAAAELVPVGVDRLARRHSAALGLPDRSARAAADLGDRAPGPGSSGGLLSTSHARARLPERRPRAATRDSGGAAPGGRGPAERRRLGRHETADGGCARARLTAAPSDGRPTRSRPWPTVLPPMAWPRSSSGAPEIARRRTRSWPQPCRPRSISSAGPICAALGGVLPNCRGLVSNDSGAMHFAAAIGVAVTAMFGPTEEWATRPLGRKPPVVLIHDVWCRPCMLRECPIDHRCMRGITADSVLAAARQAM